MGLDGEVLDAGMGRQEERDGGPEAAATALLLEQVRDGARTGRLLREGLVDGGGQRRGAVIVEEREEPSQLGHARIAVRGPPGEEPIEGGHGLAQARAGGDRPRRVFGGGERGDMGRLYYAEHWRVGTIAAQLGVHHETVAAPRPDPAPAPTQA